MQDRPFESFMDYAPMPIGILDASLRFVKVNHAMAELQRMSAADHPGNSVAEILPNLANQLQALLAKAMVTGSPAVVTINDDSPLSAGMPRRWLTTCFLGGEFPVAIMALESTDHTSESALQRSNRQLEVTRASLEQSLVVNEMVHCLQAPITVGELYKVFERFASRLFPRHSGMLHVIDSSRDLMEVTAAWGESSGHEIVSLPNGCWALREGRTHLVRDTNAERTCPHAASDGQYAQVCVPIMVQSVTLGVLHLQNRTGGASDDPFTEAELRFIQIVAEEIAQSLANIRLREVLRHQAFRDPLTGAYNRRFLAEALDIELRRARRKHLPVALVMIDVDDFKRFNDTYGHGAGDMLLWAMATSLQSSVRANDILCRYGGDEFCLVMPEASLEDAMLWANRWRVSARALSVEWEGKRLPCATVSIGASAYPGCLTSDALLLASDLALYAAKESGRDQVKATVSAHLPFAAQSL